MDVHVWMEQDSNVRVSLATTTFLAAQEVGAVPSNLACPAWPSGLKSQPHCLIEARSSDGLYFLVRSGIALFLMRVGQEKPVFEFPLGVGIGSFLNDGMSALVSKSLDRQAYQSDGISDPVPLFRFPSQDTIFGNLEASPNMIVGPAADGNFVVAFDGAFIGVREMTYLASYARDGKELWRIRERLPQHSSERFTGDISWIYLFDRGRVGAFRKRSEPTRTRIIDVSNGREIGSLEGRVIGASRNGSTILLQTSPNKAVYVQWSQ